MTNANPQQPVYPNVTHARQGSAEERDLIELGYTQTRIYRRRGIAWVVMHKPTATVHQEHPENG